MKAHDVLNENIIDLPSDLMVTPIQAIEANVNVCYSESLKKWYILRNDTYFAFGEWLDCSMCIDDHFSAAPFIWGKPIKSLIHKYDTYIPFWEDVPTGETQETEDGWIYEVEQTHYKLLHVFNFDLIEPENTVQANYNIRTDIEEFTNLADLVRTLQWRTGKHF